MITWSWGTPIALISSVQAIAAAPCAVRNDANVLEVAAGQVTGVDQAGGRDDRGSVLVVVEDRDVHPLAKRLLDDEAVRRGDVFQVDPAEARLEQFHRLDELCASSVATSMSIESTSAKRLNSTALPSITGLRRALRDCRGRGSPCRWI
jgi:hypothetical protein